jgi:hypothetical protein
MLKSMWILFLLCNRRFKSWKLRLSGKFDFLFPQQLVIHFYMYWGPPMFYVKPPAQLIEIYNTLASQVFL